MPSLRACNHVSVPGSVRALADIAGVGGVVSLRELIVLLGDAAFGPRPLYVLGHNTNTIADVNVALDSGANALEIDVTAYEFDLDQLCVDHAGLTGDSPGGAPAPRFEDFLRGLRQVADDHPTLALVVFDCKPPAATPAHGQAILHGARRLLSGDTGINIILSIADAHASTPYKLDGTSMFDAIAPALGPRDGAMIDQVGTPDDVAAFFRGLGIARHCYGHGTSLPVSDEGAMVYRLPVERACWMRAVAGAPRFVYAWTVNGETDLRLYLRIGVDGMICDPDGIANLVGILREPEFAASRRLATRADNPFLPADAAYGLTVHTSDIDMAGTDAVVTFTVTGSLGSSSVTIDAKYNGRLERNSTNFIVLPSPDLGDLKKLSVRRDGGGNAPDWHLDTVVVQSARYAQDHTASFDSWIGQAVDVVRRFA